MGIEPKAGSDGSFATCTHGAFFTQVDYCRCVRYINLALWEGGAHAVHAAGSTVTSAMIGSPRESLQRGVSVVQKPQSAHLWGAGCNG